MPDFRVQSNFIRHPKFIRMSIKYGTHGIVGVFCLWAHAAEFRPSGRLEKMIDEEVIIACHITFESPEQGREYLNDLIEFGFLDRGEDGVLQVHGWEERQPWVIGSEGRVKQARRAAKARWGNGSMQDVCPQHAGSTCGEHAGSMPGAHAASMPSSSSSPSPKNPLSSPPKGDEREFPTWFVMQTYETILPSHPKVAELTVSLMQAIEKQWAKHPDQAWWESYFGLVGRCPYLCGEGPDSWKASLTWLLNQKNMAKVLSGHYAQAEPGAKGKKRRVETLTDEEAEAMQRETEAEAAQASPN